MQNQLIKKLDELAAKIETSINQINAAIEALNNNKMSINQTNDSNNNN